MKDPSTIITLLGATAEYPQYIPVLSLSWMYVCTLRRAILRRYKINNKTKRNARGRGYTAYHHACIYLLYEEYYYTK